MGSQTPQMQLKGPASQDLLNEIDVLQRMLNFSGKMVLELGCGAAEKTRQIAEKTDVKSIVASEVDEQQHAKNLLIHDLPRVRFKDFGAEDIAESDDSFDIILMFKSLHHVPLESLSKAFSEMHRVLKPGGQLYVSEPVFDGAFNEVLRVFHDEEHVRQKAFDAVQEAIEQGGFQLKEEYFFRNEIRMASFEQYEQRMLNVTHTDHELTSQQYDEVKRRFLANESDAGFVFEIPNRVDLLSKVAS